MEHIKEARRYLKNAKEILSEKAKKQDGFYTDKKYVKIAGHTAYLGVLLALDKVLGAKKKGRKSEDWYNQELSKQDKKITSVFDSTYDLLHLSLGYDGNPDAEVAQIALKNAERIIEWAELKSN
ncbi:MAG: DUF5618 family protein [Bacteroidota bacterium]|nr:DUF5618 family protein [Bacteroidota bacterium]